jgi:hypothetical protein
MIQISAQYGDQNSTRFIRPFHKKLNDILEKVVVEKFFKNILKLSIVLRVSGEIWKYKGEGPEKIVFMKKKNEMTIDLIIPESKWKAVGEIEFKSYIENSIRQCFGLLLERAKKENELTDEDGIQIEFNNAMKEFAK